MADRLSMWATSAKFYETIVVYIPKTIRYICIAEFMLVGGLVLDYGGTSGAV